MDIVVCVRLPERFQKEVKKVLTSKPKCAKNVVRGREKTASLAKRPLVLKIEKRK